ncbi:MAG: bifunctional hydroxymethylpyrimidine kinase/phosphomethylpyrimidine kinase, partial [Raoultibacter sp.]
MKAVLSIAGSDSSGGAGIQADIKTIAAHKLFAETVITALTAQNTTGVYGVQESDPAFVGLQIDTVFDDIVPDAVKVGMVSSAAIIETIADHLVKNKARNIVVDPVMIATSGARLIDEDAIGALCTRLIPLADIITPNIPEAAALCGFAIECENDMLAAGKKLTEMCHGAVLIKGGHRSDDANDLLITRHGREVWLRHKRIDTRNTHGTGCTLSAAIACNLAQDFDMQACVQKAKNYITGALMDDLALGRGNGPLNHMWNY